ncbi:MAG: hypothetical protein DRQ51_04040 [Gammaproteobacteria bacterium]|nr:MAG: hypothetical protein DRQ51_04040 [Gammaproteobacteria bacterium]
MKPIKLTIKSIGVLTYGIDNYEQAIKFLKNNNNFADLKNQDIDLKPIENLPRNERRRTNNHIKIAVNVALQHQDIQDTQIIFASCDGDTNISHKLCQAVSSSDKFISPADFHNSVHNAPSGYCSIAIKSHLPINSISTDYNNMFTTTLMEAAIKVKLYQKPILIVLFDDNIHPQITTSRKRTLGAISFLMDSNNSQNKDNKNICQIEINKTPKNKDNRVKNENIPFWHNPAHQAWQFLQQINNKNQIQNYQYLKNSDLQIKLL